MRDIDKAVKLYRLMAERCASTGLSPVQAELYAEMADFIAPCETAEEASEKLKNSRYYTAGAAAVFRDKMLALSKVFSELNMPEVAEIYQAKEREVALDESKMYDASYEQRALSIRKKLLEKRESIAMAIKAWVQLRCAEGSSEAEDEAYTELEKAIDQLGGVSGFDDAVRNIAAKGYVEEVLTVPDIYEKLISDAPDRLKRYQQPGFVSDGAKKAKAEFDSAWAAVKAKEAEVKALGARLLPKVDRANAIAVSPSDAGGSYEFVGERRE